jgi:hypothetical protein
MDQTCFAKLQSLQRCVGVSRSIPQSLHIGSFGQFRLIRLFDVRIFLCSNILTKNIHLGSAFAFQIGVSFSLLNVNWNWMQYVLLAVYSPSADIAHLVYIYFLNYYLISFYSQESDRFEMDSVGGHQLLLLLEVEGTNCTRRQTVICLRQYSREKDAFSLFFANTQEYCISLY